VAARPADLQGVASRGRIRREGAGGGQGAAQGPDLAGRALDPQGEGAAARLIRAAHPCGEDLISIETAGRLEKLIISIGNLAASGRLAGVDAPWIRILRDNARQTCKRALCGRYIGTDSLLPAQDSSEVSGNIRGRRTRGAA